MSTLAIIPARAGSKRVPDKNMRPFLGLPLITWTIRFARKLGIFDQIVVSTDSERIAAHAESEGIPVPWLRPAALASDTSTSVDMALHALERESAAGRHHQHIALLQPTSPIRLAQRWQNAISKLGDDENDAVIGLVPAKAHPYHLYQVAQSGSIAPFVDDDGQIRKLRSQDLPPAFAIGGNLYVIRTATLINERTFFPLRTAGIVCDDPCEALDIDTVADWLAAEAVAQHYKQGPCQRS